MSEIFILVRKMINAKGDAELAYLSKELKLLEDNDPDVIFAQEQGRSCIEAAFLQSKKYKDYRFTERVVNILLDHIEKHPDKNKVESFLAKEHPGQYRILQSVLRADLPNLFKRTIKLLHAYPKALQKNLANRTKDGSMPLSHAFVSNDERIIMQLFEEMRPYPKILEMSLSNRTDSGFMLLECAFKTNNERIIAIIFEELKKHPRILEQNLGNRTNDGYMLLNCALVTRNENVVSQLIEELMNHRELLVKNIDNFTKNGFMPIDHAFLTDNEKVLWLFLQMIDQYKEESKKNIVTRSPNGYLPLNHLRAMDNVTVFSQVIKLIKKYPGALERCLANRTNDGYMPLNSALVIGDWKVVEKLLKMLKKDPEALRKNLSNRLKDGSMALDIALEKGNAKCVGLILEALEKDEELLKICLTNRRAKGFMPLDSALVLGKEEVVTQIIETLKRFPKLLEANLANRTNDYFSPLDSALRIGNEKVIAQIFELLRNYPDLLKNSIDNFTKHGFTPIFTVFKSGTLKSIQLMLAHFQQCLSPERQLNLLHSSFLLKEVIEREPYIINAYLGAFVRLFQDRRKAARGFRHLIKSINPPVSDRIMSELVNKVLYEDFSKQQAELEEIQKDFAAKVGKTSIANVEVSHFLKEDTISAQPRLKKVRPNSTSFMMPLPQLETSNKPLITINHDHDLVVKPFSGINHKYLEENPKPVIVQSNAQPLFSKNKKCEFIPLEKYFSPQSVQYEPYSIHNKTFMATFYSQRGDIQRDEAVTFVCAGRKENALIPPVTYGRVVIVCTQEEYKQFYKKLDKVDVLVTHSIKHTILGHYEALGSIACRRLSILLAAHHWQLNTCAMLDDNILHVDFNAGEGSWDDFYQLLKQELGREPCVSVSRHYSHAPQPGQLGSKIFLYDMRKLRKEFSGLEALCLLVPPQMINKWGEDFLKQIILHFAYQPKAQGFRVIDKEKGTFIRSGKKRNAFRNANSKAPTLAEPLSFPVELLEQLPTKQRTVLEKAMDCFNDIIALNRDLRNALNEQAKNKNYGNQESLPAADFIKKLPIALQQANANQTLRYYQIEAVKNAAKVKSRDPMQIVMATGTGKTYVECELATLAYSMLNTNEHIIVVTANINLVEQFRDDMHTYMQKLNRFIEEVYAISSKHIPIEYAASLGLFMEKPKIFIFCIESLLHLIAKNPNFLSQARMVLLDEYHEYYKNAVRISEISKQFADGITLGFTATPPENSVFRAVYSYSRFQAVKDGFLAPIIVDRLGANYSKDNVKGLVQLLPQILSEQNHPRLAGIGKLFETKGIVFLPSIKACNKAKALLDAFKIKSYAIHSENVHYKEELAQGKKSERVVFIACEMCKLGLDDPELGYIIIGQNPQSNANLEQIIGRVVRRKIDKDGKVIDKAGYVLAFNDVINRSEKQLVGEQTLPTPISREYLETSHQYKYTKKNKTADHQPVEIKKASFTISPLTFMKDKGTNLRTLRKIEEGTQDIQRCDEPNEVVYKERVVKEIVIPSSALDLKYRINTQETSGCSRVPIFKKKAKQA